MMMRSFLKSTLSGASAWSPSGGASVTTVCT
jgi:hypothetical protein